AEGVETPDRILHFQQHPRDRLVHAEQAGRPRPTKLSDTETLEEEVVEKVSVVIQGDEGIPEKPPQRDSEKGEHAPRNRPRVPIRLAGGAWERSDYSARACAGGGAVRDFHNVVSIRAEPRGPRSTRGRVGRVRRVRRVGRVRRVRRVGRLRNSSVP